MKHDRAIDPLYGTAEVFAYFSEISRTAQLAEALLGKAIPDGLHRSHFFIINHLARGGDGQQPVQIAAAMQVTKATMSHSLAVLEKRGFIVTIRCDLDARSKNVYVTEAGRKIQAQTVRAVIRMFGSFLRKDDFQMMGEALPRLLSIRKRLDENRNATPD